MNLKANNILNKSNKIIEEDIIIGENKIPVYLLLTENEYCGFIDIYENQIVKTGAVKIKYLFLDYDNLSNNNIMRMNKINNRVFIFN